MLPDGPTSVGAPNPPRCPQKDGDRSWATATSSFRPLKSPAAMKLGSRKRIWLGERGCRRRAERDREGGRARADHCRSCFRLREITGDDSMGRKNPWMSFGKEKCPAPSPIRMETALV